MNLNKIYNQNQLSLLLAIVIMIFLAACTEDNLIENYGEESIEPVELKLNFMTANPENTGNKWRAEIEYSIEIEQFLFRKSNLFINTLDSRDAKSSNPQFLKPLIGEISDYLSRYIKRSRTTNRNNVTKEIKKILWEENTHIQYILSKQQEYRNASNKKSYIKERNKQKSIAKANFDYNIAKQVQSEFIAVNQYRRKK